MEDNAIKLKYGIRNGMVVSIDELSVMDRGLQCHCVCPGCGQELQARIGTGKRQPHFAHNNTSCDIHSAHQTALHLMAKEIIEQEKKIKLPPIFVKLHDIASELGDYDGYTLPDEVEAIAGTIVDCDRVIVEKRLSSIVPDLIIETHGKQLLVEIAVTHFVDEEKQVRVRQLGIPMIEINLRSLVNEQCSRSDLKKILINQPDCKCWIYTPKENEARIRGIEKYKQLMREQKAKVEHTKRKEAVAKRNKEIQDQRKAQAEKLVENLKVSENYRKAVLLLRNDEAFETALEHRSFYKRGMELPFFMDIPITGEMIFECDRRIWQSAIFDKFIYNRNPQGHHTVSVIKIVSWIKEHQHEFNLNPILRFATVPHIYNRRVSQNLYNTCIYGYLEWLGCLGFVTEINHYEARLLCTHSLSSPNEDEARYLESAIRTVDEYCWNVSTRIHDQYKLARSMARENIRRAPGLESQVDSSAVRHVEVETTNQYAYADGYREIVTSGLFDSMELPPKDQYGHRWKKCRVCESIKRDDEMASYQGKYGLCEECDKTKQQNG